MKLLDEEDFKELLGTFSPFLQKGENFSLRGF